MFLTSFASTSNYAYNNNNINNHHNVITQHHQHFPYYHYCCFLIPYNNNRSRSEQQRQQQQQQRIHQRHQQLICTRWIISIIILFVYFTATTTTVFPFEISSSTSPSSSFTSISRISLLRRGNNNNYNNNKMFHNQNSNEHEQQQHYYVFWLMPSSRDKAMLQNIVNELSDEYNTVNFVPHVTLAPPVPVENIPNVKQAMGTISMASSNIKLEQPQITIGNKYTQSIFMKFNEDNMKNPALFHLYNVCKQVSSPIIQLTGDELKPPAPQDNFPHMSLMYSDFNYKEKESIVKYEIPKMINNNSIIEFDSVQIIRIHLPVIKPEDVIAWELIDEITLKPTS